MKYFAGGITTAACMLVIVVLVIRHETAKMRQSLKTGAIEAARDGVDAAIERAPEAAAKTAGRVLDTVLKPQSRTPQDPAPQQKGPQEEAHAPPHTPGPTDSLPPPQNPMPPRIDPVGIVGGILDTATHTAKTVDDLAQAYLPLDDEQERELGREIHRIALRAQKCIEDPSIEAKIKELAGPIVAIRGRKNVNYTFTIIDDPNINAFSHAGGYIYVHKGLLQVARSDVELQFVLGHEIGHVDLKHVLRGFSYTLPVAQWTHEVVAQLAQIAYQKIALGYSQELEFEADEYAFRRMLKIGRTREEALAFTAHFARYASEKGWDQGNRRSSSTPTAIMQEIQNHLRTHPPADQRLKRLEGLKT